jgi:hypothetical protein
VIVGNDRVVYLSRGRVVEVLTIVDGHRLPEDLER